MQAIFLPAMALAFAAAPLAGQNFGAGHAQRVRQTFSSAASLSAIVMLCLTVTLQMLCSLMLLRQQFRLRLTGVSAAALS
jgi:Na+-driven multidrug efflux pump